MDEGIEVRGDLILDQACISEHKMIHNIEIKLNNNIHKSPTPFGKTVVWIKLYEYYKYYYNKYAQKI